MLMGHSLVVLKSRHVTPGLFVTPGPLLIAAANGPEDLEKEFTYSMRMLWRYRQKRKPGRKFDRIARSPNSKWKRTTYNTTKNEDH